VRSVNTGGRGDCSDELLNSPPAYEVDVDLLPAWIEQGDALLPEDVAGRSLEQLLTEPPEPTQATLEFDGLDADASPSVTVNMDTPDPLAAVAAVDQTLDIDVSSLSVVGQSVEREEPARDRRVWALVAVGLLVGSLAAMAAVAAFSSDDVPASGDAAATRGVQEGGGALDAEEIIANIIPEGATGDVLAGATTAARVAMEAQSVTMSIANEALTVSSTNDARQKLSGPMGGAKSAKRVRRPRKKAGSTRGSTPSTEDTSRPSSELTPKTRSKLKDTLHKAGDE